MKNQFSKIKLTLLSLVIIGFGGCSSMQTSTEQYKTVDKLVNQERFSDAAINYNNTKEEYFEAKDRVQFWIDLGLLHHYAYEDSLAIKDLMSADFAMEELYTTSISKGAISMVLNDNALDYSGEDYENLYVNVFKALSFYRSGSTEGALVEIRRLIEKFVTLQQKYEVEFNSLKNSDDIKTEVNEVSVDFYSSALAHYLSMVMFLSDGAYDDARISRDKFYNSFDSQKELYNFSKPNLDGFLENSKNPKLAFIAFTGRAPLKYEYVFQLDTFKDQIVISVFENGKWKNFSTIFWRGVGGGLHAKFAVPKMQKRGSVVENIQIFVDGNHAGDLYKIESLEDIAYETFKREEALIYMKSLARTITKAIANEALNKELDKQTGGGGWGDLTRLVSGIAINMTENADLRISHYFPSFAYGGEFEVTPGTHNIEVIYLDQYKNVIATDKFENYNVSPKKRIDLIETVFLQ